MPVSNLDALIKESVSGETLAAAPFEQTVKISLSNINPNKPTLSNCSASSSGVRSLINSSIDFEKNESTENPLYDALERNPNIIHVSRKEDMFKPFSYFSRNSSSSNSSSNSSQSSQNSLNGFRKDLCNGKSANHQVNDDVPLPKFHLFQGQIDVNWRNRGLQAGSGLHNQGNTCFLNSVLQCLAYTAPLYNVLVDDNHAAKACKIQSQNCMLCEVQRTVKRIFDHPQNAISPNSIVHRIREIGKCFHPGRQEDAHEFLIHFFESMQKACLNNKPKLDNYTQSTSLLHQIFGGYSRSQVICSKCHNRSNTYETFLTLSIDVQHCQSIRDSLGRYTKKEFLGNANLYKCEKCKQKVEATRRVTFHRLPKILVLHLKRFNYNGLNMKLSKHLNFPDILEMNHFLSEGVSRAGAQYQLYAVLVHSGFSSHSGHYYCFVKAPNGMWYKCNDSHVSKCSVNMAMQSEAYMLFYSQKQPPQQKNEPSDNTSLSSKSPLSESNKIADSMSKSPIMNGKAHHLGPKQKLSLDGLTNGIREHHKPTLETFPKVGASAVKNSTTNSDRDSISTSSTSTGLKTSSSTVKPTLSFKIPKRSEENEANDMNNSKMLQNANENLLQKCHSYSNVQKPATESSSLSSSSSSGYDRLHPFASSESVNGKGSEKSKSVLQNGKGAERSTTLVSYALAEDSDGSDSDDSGDDDNQEREREYRKKEVVKMSEEDGQPRRKMAKIDCTEAQNKVTNDDNSSTISSNLSFFTSSGSNSATDLSERSNTSAKNAQEGKAKTSKYFNCDQVDRTKLSLKNGRSKSGINSAPASPRYGTDSLFLRSNGASMISQNGSINTDLTQNGCSDLSGETLCPLENAGSRMLDGSMSDTNGGARSPSVSSNESKSSMGSTKKASQLQKFKEKVKQRFKSTKFKNGTASPAKREVTISTVNSDSPVENENKGNMSNRFAASPYDEHNYVQYKHNNISNINNTKTDCPSDSKSENFRPPFQGHKMAAINGGSSITWNERSGSPPSSQNRMKTQPVPVPKNSMRPSSLNSGRDLSLTQTQSFDLVGHLTQQAVTKSWNGEHLSASVNLNKSFSYGSNGFAGATSRYYDDFDEEVDRGNCRKRKSDATFNRNNNYNHNNNYIESRGNYKGGFYNHNEHWYQHDRNMNKFQSFHDNRHKNRGFNNHFDNRNRGSYSYNKFH